MSDQELLRLAAKAAGEEVEWLPTEKAFFRKSCSWPQEKGWFNPMHDDGEALRLAIKLDIHIKRYAGATTCIELMALESITEHDHWEVNHGDPMRSTRLAIVRSAAKIGESMP